MTELGKHIASSAILSPHPSHTGSSGHGGKLFCVFISLSDHPHCSYKPIYIQPDVFEMETRL